MHITCIELYKSLLNQRVHNLHKIIKTNNVNDDKMKILLCSSLAKSHSLMSF